MQRSALQAHPLELSPSANMHDVRIRICLLNGLGIEKFELGAIATAPEENLLTFVVGRAQLICNQVAESMGFKGDFGQWEDLLRVGD